MLHYARYVTALAIWLLATTSYAQLLSLKPEYSQYEAIEITLTTPENGQVLFDLKPLDSQTRYEVKEYTEAYAFWGEPGRYEVEVIVITIDFDTKTFDVDREKSVFKVLGKSPVPPEPEPEPEPSVPEDRFDNLGQRIQAKIIELNVQRDKALRLADCFIQTADQMEERRILSVAAAAQQIASCEQEVNLDAAVRNIYVTDGKERSPLSFEAAIEWYRAVAVGLKGGA